MDDYVFQLKASGNFGSISTTCFAARRSGLYRSQDSGYTWQGLEPIRNLSEPLPCTAVEVVLRSNQSPLLFAGIGVGVLRSLDGGDSWVAGRTANPAPVVSALAASPDAQRDQILFAATLEDGVMFTADLGESWTSWNFGLLDLNTLCLGVSPQFSADETIFVGTQSGLFRSTNGGRAWRELDLPIGYDAILSLALSPHFEEDGTLFAGSEAKGLLRSTNSGDSWEKVGMGLEGIPINSILVAAGFPRSLEILLIHGGVPLVSPDGGANWRRWRETACSTGEVTSLLVPQNFDQPALAAFADGSVLYI